MTMLSCCHQEDPNFDTIESVLHILDPEILLLKFVKLFLFTHFHGICDVS